MRRLSLVVLVGGMAALVWLASLCVNGRVHIGIDPAAVGFGRADPGPTPAAIAGCFPFHRPQAQGPGPAPYYMRIEGPQPAYPDVAPLTAVGERWPLAKGKVEVWRLPPLANVMWYGQDPNLTACLRKQGLFPRSTTVTGGRWESSVGGFIDEPNDTPTVLAVDQDGRYLLQPAVQVGRGAVPPYKLTVRPYPGEEPQADAPGLPEIMLDQPFRLRGEGLSWPDGPVRIHLNVDGLTDLGTGIVKKGRIDAAPLRIPPTLESGAALSVPQNYQLVITSDRRPYEIYQLLTVQVRPDLSDRALLEHFWQLEQVQSQPIFQQFRFFQLAKGCAPSYTETPPPDLAGTAYCRTLIRRTRPADDLPTNFQGTPQPGWRTVVLVMDWVDNGRPKQGEWRFILNGDAQLQALRPTGDLPPER